jgi:hypothetical protein
MNERLAEQVMDQLQTLPPEHQRRVLDFARALAVVTPAGVPGKALVEFVGTIPSNDLKRMAQVIQEGCEQVDQNGW